MNSCFPSFLIYRYFMEHQFSTCNITVDDHSVRIPLIVVTTSNNTSVIKLTIFLLLLGNFFFIFWFMDLLFFFKIEKKNILQTFYFYFVLQRYDTFFFNFKTMSPRTTSIHFWILTINDEHTKQTKFQNKV